MGLNPRASALPNWYCFKQGTLAGGMGTLQDHPPIPRHGSAIWTRQIRRMKGRAMICRLSFRPAGTLPTAQGAPARHLGRLGTRRDRGSGPPCLRGRACSMSLTLQAERPTLLVVGRVPRDRQRRRGCGTPLRTRRWPRASSHCLP